MIQDLRRRQGKGHVSNVSKGLSRSEEREMHSWLGDSSEIFEVRPVLGLLGRETFSMQNI
jgi:hypothetical protein